IVPIHDFDQRDGRTFIVMALMSGGSLKEQIESYGAMDHNHVKTILEQVASGLAYAHERDVIHRDLKPGNILLDDKGVARISDFGFARAISADSMSMSMGGGMLGTPSYMAPEIWEGKPPVPASDIYSLGCIAHEMLSGEQLFQGETPVQIMHDHIVRGPVPIEGIAPAWQSFLDRCLQANPADRYSSANAVLEDLKWGLFDAPVKQRETEIVIGGLEDNQDAIAGEQTTYQSEIGPLKDAEYSSSPTVPLTYHPYTGEAQYTMGQKLEFEAANLEPVYSEGQLLEFEAEKARKKRWILPTILVMLSVLFISILLLFSNIVKQKKEVSNASNMTTHSLNEARVLHENDTTSLVASTASAISTNQTLNAEPTEEIVLTPKTDEASEKPVFTSVLTRQIDGME
ncbi:MAG TPA: serine/threonine-protein kinase, partial [Anaerolineaceae bacterium]|nr:serine/threonine-protein kinase [Anaerolineaceae bacterium]